MSAMVFKCKDCAGVIFAATLKTQIIQDVAEQISELIDDGYRPHIMESDD